MTTAPTAPAPAGPTRLGFLGIPLLALLAVQFLLGMSLNLFVTLPNGNAVAILDSSPTLLAHVAVAVLLLGLAANVVRTAARYGTRRDLLVAGLGLISGLVAFVAGLWFTFDGGSNAASFVMSAGFLGMVLEAAYLLRSHPAPEPSRAVGPRPGGRGSEGP